MTVGFFTIFKTDPLPFLHATALVADVQRVMPGVPVRHLTDATTPTVRGAEVVRIASTEPLLHQRLDHYRRCEGEWLLVDTDVSLRADVRGVFDDPTFDVALVDRDWPEQPQGEDTWRTMPFNTGVVFVRTPAFWQAVFDLWRTFPATAQDWYSEQRAVWQVVRTGQFKVKILPGLAYNYPPRTREDVPIIAAALHYKGSRKQWLTERIYAEARR